MQVTEEILYEWIEKEDVKAMTKWLEKTDDVDYVYSYEVEYDYDEDDVYTEEKWSQPALYIAVYKQKSQMVKLLLEYGANPNLTTHDHDCSLYVAVEKQNLDIVGMLLAYGANPSLKGSYGKTPLMCAVSDMSNANYREQNKYDSLDPKRKEIKLRIITLLLKAGANPTEKVEGFPLTPYAISMQRADKEVICLLENYLDKK